MQGFVLQDFTYSEKSTLRRHLLIPQIMCQFFGLVFAFVAAFDYEPHGGSYWEEFWSTAIFSFTIATFTGLMMSTLSLKIEAIKSRKYRLAIMAEAAGDHTKAIEIIRKHGSPHLLFTYRQRYQNDLANQKNYSTNVPGQTQNPSVINIHNVQAQQGPTEINVQDSVVTDWNQ